MSDVSETLARLTLSRHANLLEHFCQEYLDEGVASAVVYAEILAPAGRFIIDLWASDKISYSEVTIALGRLQRLVRELPADTAYNGADDPRCRSALFAPTTGERQTFGFYIMEEQFRWAGWRTWTEPTASGAEMNALVRGNWFDLICLSVTRDAPVSGLSHSISAMRRASRNRELFVLLAESPSTKDSVAPESVGADAAASSGDEAMDIMDEALRRDAA